MPRKRNTLVGVAVVAALLAAGCGSDVTTATDLAAATNAPPTTETAGPSTTAAPSSTEATSTTTTPATTESPLENGIPLADDPCVSPAAHLTDGVAHEYSFDFRGEEVPVGIRIGSPQALEPDSTIWVALHGAGNTWQFSFVLVGPVVDSTPSDSTVVVAPQAQAGDRAFWSQDAKFNAEYLAALFTVLERSFCLENSETLLVGGGQGTLAVAQGICTHDLPVDLAHMVFGMVKMVDCDPPRAVPIISYDIYDFNPIFGAHWDGAWNPPSTLEVELTGGIQSTPDDLAHWAEVYNCTDEVTEMVVPDPDDRLERDSVVLSHWDCDAPLAAIGYQNDSVGGAGNQDAVAGLEGIPADLAARMTAE